MKRRAVLSAGRSQYVSPNRGLKLLDEAIDQIELHAKAAEKGGVSQWDQGSWRCGSGMCLAGWVDQLAGGQWLTKADEDNPDDYEDYLSAEPDDLADDVEDTPHGKAVHARERALRLLGLDDDYANADDSLFSADNTVEDIRSIRAKFIAKGVLK
jgi:hypothetical protein